MKYVLFAIAALIGVELIAPAFAGTNCITNCSGSGQYRSCYTTCY